MKKPTKKVLIITLIIVAVFAVSGAVAMAAANISDIEELYLAFRTAQANSAVESGDMTADEAQEYLSNLSERLEQDENDAVPPLRGGRGCGMQAGQPNAALIYAQVSGLSIDEIKDACDGGTTVFAMADEAGLLDELKAAMTEEANARIDELLADGRVTQEQADEMKADSAESISAITADTQTPMQRGPMQGRMGNFGGCR